MNENTPKNCDEKMEAFEEFVESIEAGSHAAEKTSFTLPPPPFPTNKNKSILTQYTTNGDSYSPASDTIQTLPAACYTLSVSQRGEMMYVKQDIITDSLLRLPDSKSDEVVAEVSKFWTLKPLFKKYGFSHKRGFLLWGPPGSGKTSTIAMILDEMVKNNGLVFIAESPTVLSYALKQLRQVEPDRPVTVIWEDLDAIVYTFGESSVLSVLDGENQVENVIFIATTNYPEKLDGRISNRPSRFDKIVYIGMPNAAARELYLKSKIDNVKMDGVDLVKETEGLSIAHIKELIVSVFCQGNPVKEVLKRLAQMKRTPKSDSSNLPIGFNVT